MRLLSLTGPAGDLHDRPFPEGLDTGEAWLLEAERPALVLGSSQSEATADSAAARAAGVDVVRRRSGGGAVYVDPRRSLWLDVLVGRGDPRWSDDVRAATHWLGEAWCTALRRVGLAAEVHRGGLEQTSWGRLVCFAAIGPGEVILDGRKLVGISQRRTRAGARFQCIVYDRWDPDDVLDLLDLTDTDRRSAAADLDRVATGVGDRLQLLREALVKVLVGD